MEVGYLWHIRSLLRCRKHITGNYRILGAWAPAWGADIPSADGIVASTVGSSRECEERDRLQAAYSGAVSLWMNVGGTDPERMSLPVVIAAKKDLDDVAKQLIDHRADHGC